MLLSKAHIEISRFPLSIRFTFDTRSNLIFSLLCMIAAIHTYKQIYRLITPCYKPINLFVCMHETMLTSSGDDTLCHICTYDHLVMVRIKDSKWNRDTKMVCTPTLTNLPSYHGAAPGWETDSSVLFGTGSQRQYMISSTPVWETSQICHFPWTRSH